MGSVITCDRTKVVLMAKKTWAGLSSLTSKWMLKSLRITSTLASNPKSETRSACLRRKIGQQGCAPTTIPH